MPIIASNKYKQFCGGNIASHLRRFNYRKEENNTRDGLITEKQ